MQGLATERPPWVVHCASRRRSGRHAGDGTEEARLHSGRHQRVHAFHAREPDFHSLRKGQFHLLFRPSRDHAELFDLQRDPQERSDVSDRYPLVVASMRRELEAVLDGAVPTLPESTTELRAEEVEPLRALGYLDAGESRRER
jgi:hypothetical protein